MRRLFKTKVAFGIFAIVLWGGIFCAPGTYAKIKSADSLYKLSILQGVRSCYEYATNEITDLEFSANGGWESVFSDHADLFDKEDGAWITTHVGNSLNSGLNNGFERDSNLSCKEVFEGYGKKAKGLQDYYVLPTTPIGMGYEKIGEDISSGGGTLWFTLSSIKDETKHRAEIKPEEGENRIECALTDAVDKLGAKIGQKKIAGCVGEISVKENSGDKEPKFRLKFNGGIKPEIVKNVAQSNSFYGPGYENREVGAWFEAVTGSTSSELEASLEKNVINKLNESLKSEFFVEKGVTGMSVRIIAKHAIPSWEYGYKNENISSLYALARGSKTRAAGIMLYNLGVDSSLLHTDLQNSISVAYLWNEDWKYSLYYLYLVDMMGRYPNDIKIESCGEDIPNSNWKFKNSSSTWCAISISNAFADRLDGEDFVVSVPGSSLSMRRGKFKEILEWLSKETSYNFMSEDAYAEAKINEDGSISGYSREDNENFGVCYESSGRLSWILCPIISGASGIGAHMWDRIENYHLKIPAQEVFESGGGVQQAWGVVRDVANLAFIVLLLFVIFSQLTGVGIDNYGIKKILPKLIIVAVLVNLSYLICQLAVDLSNLLGIGLNSLLSGFANNLDNIEITASSATVGGGAMDVVLGLGGVGLYGLLAGGTTMGSAFLLGGAAIGLMALGVVITVVAAMVVLYLILVVREAGIILAIVVAPVAIVCYMLPNTEKIYKKWLGLFKGLLLVYPICGAMVGAGRLAGVTLASIDSGSMKVAAMIVQVLPFFFIPMLLKSSLALMGNVGAKISTLGRGLGRKVSSTTQGAIKGSERFKDMEQFNKEKGLLKRANRIISKYNGKEGLSDRQLLRFRKASNIVSGRREELHRGRNLADGGLEAALIAQDKRADEEGISNKVVSVLEDTHNGSNYNELLNKYIEFKQADDANGMRAVVRVIGKRKDFVKDFMAKFSDNNDRNYGAAMMASNGHANLVDAVAKEIATGESSATYKASSPLRYKFASSINENSGQNPNYNYAASNNIKALNAFVTNPSEFVSMSKEEMREINTLIEDIEREAERRRTSGDRNSYLSYINGEDYKAAQGVRELAQTVYANRKNPAAVYDRTKETEILALMGGSGAQQGGSGPGIIIASDGDLRSEINNRR